MSICRHRITSVIPIAATAAGPVATARLRQFSTWKKPGAAPARIKRMIP